MPQPGAQRLSPGDRANAYWAEVRAGLRPAPNHKRTKGEKPERARRVAKVRPDAAAVEYKVDALTEAVTRLVEAQAQLAEAMARFLVSSVRPIQQDRALQSAPLSPEKTITGPDTFPPGTTLYTCGHAHVSRDEATECRRAQLDAAGVSRAESRAAASNGGEDRGAGTPAVTEGPPADSGLPPEETASPLGGDLVAEMLAELGEEDEPPPPPDVGATWDLWQRRLDLYQGNRMWLPAWGARPGQSGCEAPPSLLEERGIVPSGMA